MYSWSINLQKGSIYCEGSQAGALVSPPQFKSRNHRFDEGFQIICSKKDKLTFRICEQSEDKKEQMVVASAVLFSENLIRYNEKDLHMNQPLECTFTLLHRYYRCFHRTTKKDAGHLKLQILYDKSQLYMGEINSLKQQHRHNEFLKLYIGKCKSRNLFSMMDQLAQGQNEEIKFFESIYRDAESKADFIFTQQYLNNSFFSRMGLVLYEKKNQVQQNRQWNKQNRDMRQYYEISQDCESPSSSQEVQMKFWTIGRYPKTKLSSIRSAGTNLFLSNCVFSTFSFFTGQFTQLGDAETFGQYLSSSLGAFMLTPVICCDLFGGTQAEPIYNISIILQLTKVNVHQFLLTIRQREDL